MDGIIRWQPLRAVQDDGMAPRDRALRQRAQLCREAVSTVTPLWRLLALSSHPDEAVRASLYGNPSFRLFAAAHAHYELGRSAVSWVTQQAVAASPFVGEEAHLAVFAMRNFECEDRKYPPRSLGILIPLVNNPTRPRKILATVVAEREFERFSDERGDDGRPTHLHHAHLRRAYKAVWEIARSRLQGLVQKTEQNGRAL